MNAGRGNLQAIERSDLVNAVEYASQISDMSVEGFASNLGQTNSRPRLLANEVLFNPDIAGFFQCRDVSAKIAIGRHKDRFQVRKLHWLVADAIQRSDDLQSHRLVDYFVRFIWRRHP